MKKAGFGKPHNSSSASGDDIPAALRDTPVAASKLRLQAKVFVFGGVAVFVLLAFISGVGFLFTAQKKNPDSQVSPANSATKDTQSGNSVNSPDNKTDTVLGHFTYQEAPESELEPITADGRMKMRKAAAQQFKAMVAAARSQGVILVPISGFRSVTDQEQLFFQVKAQRNQSAADRAAVSAPPGHSEHHTGYAADIGDGSTPATNLSPNFENTKAFGWLQANAARFSFEMSFPKDNPQGVSYEPWHWRYVGDRDSLETFYKARNLKPSQISP